MLKIRVMVATLVAVFLIPIPALAGDVIFIGNPSVPASELSSYDIKSIFLGSKIAWESGSKIVPVVQKESPCHTEFLRKYVGKTSSQFATYWKKQVFTGRGFAPEIRGNEQEIINFVTQTAGAIGYVSSDTGLDDVKIISVK